MNFEMIIICFKIKNLNVIVILLHYDVYLIVRLRQYNRRDFY